MPQSNPKEIVATLESFEFVLGVLNVHEPTDRERNADLLIVTNQRLLHCTDELHQIEQHGVSIVSYVCTGNNNLGCYVTLDDA